ncbi:preprotein translocase subunit SecE [Orrella daihaiensis]|uniref:Protein translocase subunit SecE n=1 Tax=Orrella daihaiensis TaxID=2782176 RepID=A0ABY4AR49_9BURK|nr:preprotein translocase subunit SecE [Orrella daihaiensis]UOD50524.1 preprotein translocase subunit SecE [Orrella daihaiensis]
MSNQNVQTVTSMADRIKLLAAVLVIVAGIVAFSALDPQLATPVRVAIFIVSLLVAAGIAAISEPGRRFIGFAQESYYEVRKVVWPTRKETIQMTGIVFAFVAVMGIFLWVLDKSLEWLLYSVVLGWR